MTKEKVNLENQLEAEQEYILNKLHKQVCKLRMPAPILADLRFAGVYMHRCCNISKRVREGHCMSFLASFARAVHTKHFSQEEYLGLVVAFNLCAASTDCVYGSQGSVSSVLWVCR